MMHINPTNEPYQIKTCQNCKHSIPNLKHTKKHPYSKESSLEINYKCKRFYFIDLENGKKYHDNVKLLRNKDDLCGQLGKWYEEKSPQEKLIHNVQIQTILFHTK